MSDNRVPVVRADDIGFGGNKFVKKWNALTGEMECDMFPSIALHSDGLEISDGISNERDTAIVSVGGVNYEVGKDILTCLPADYSRKLDVEFRGSDAYRAILYGSLVAMNEPVIDLLLLGLPVSVYKMGDFKEWGDKFVGEHRICVGHTVDIKKVTVLAQPHGALLDYALSNDLWDTMKDQNTLIIDPGYFTFDWLFTKGTTPNYKKSGSHSGGMSEIIKIVADQLSNSIGVAITQSSYYRIDQALRNGNDHVFINREYHSIEKFKPLIKSKVKNYIDAMLNSIGNKAEIDHIILAGGPYFLFKDVITNYFEKGVIVASDPVYSNVRGFQLAGSVRMDAIMHDRLRKA